MGLDMYLTRKIYVGAGWSHNEVTGIVDISRNGEKIDIDLSRIVDITEDVITWRKANAIHQWFVDNVQNGEDNCASYYVTPEVLQSLLEDIEEVLKNKNKAKELLPTQGGFFFGGTDYDDYYWDDLKRTKKALKEVLSDQRGGDFYYQSSW